MSGRVDRASATEAVDKGSIPGRVKPTCVVDRWQLDSKTQRSLRCLLAKAIW